MMEIRAKSIIKLTDGETNLTYTIEKGTPLISLIDMLVTLQHKIEQHEEVKQNEIN